jgi:hypothetical protein
VGPTGSGFRAVVVCVATVCCVPVALLNFVPAASAQTAVTGGLNGVVTDSSGAVVPNAKVTIVNTMTRDTRVLTTNSDGRYSAAFLEPGRYAVSASAPNMRSNTVSMQILVGQQSVGDFTITPMGNEQMVTVSANNAQLIDTQPADTISSFTTEQFQNLPNPGGDITTIAFTVPGVVVNTNSGYGYGNFSSDGLPGISNMISGNVATGSGSAPSFASASYGVMKSGFTQGLSANELAAALPAGVLFSPPTYYFAQPHMKNAKYLEWSLQMQQQITPWDAVILSYAGNYGYDLVSYDFGANQNLAGDAYLASSNYTSFEGVPVNPPDPRFAQMGTIYPAAIASYNGGSIEYKHIDRRGLTANISYTYAHSLDDISNGGQGEPFNNNGFGNQIVPNNVSKLMYSNSDYDIRSNFLLDLTYLEPYRFQNKFAQALGAGWTVASKAYWRSGLAFSVVNTNAEGDLDNGTGNGTVLAEVLNNQFNHFCNSYAHPCFQGHVFNGSGVTFSDNYGDPAQADFGNVPRNSFYGPHYADVDMSLYKNLVQKESLQFKVGAQAFNLFNAPNFAAPQNDASLSQGLGVINSDVVAPTSPYGSFGSPGSGRVMVVTGQLSF